MSQDKQKSISAMRTFARDLDRERGLQSTSEPTTETETPVQKETSPVLQNIPAFHEIQKEVRHEAEAIKPSKPEVAAPNKKISSTKKSVPGGTIITDTKKPRRPFFAELIASITVWGKSLKKELKPKSKTTYTVTSTDRRKGVVQKATSKTGTIFSTDNESLKELIKQRQIEAAQVKSEPELEWSPYTETGYPLLTPKEKVEPKPTPVPTVDTNPPVPVKEVAEANLPIEAPAVIAPPATPHYAARAKESTPAAADTTPLRTPQAPATTTVPPKPAATQSTEKVEDSNQQNFTYWFDIRNVQHINTNILTLGIVIVVAILLGTGTTVFNLLQSSAPQQTVVSFEIKNYTSYPVTPIALIEDSPAHLSFSVAGAIISNQNQAAAEFYFTDVNGRPLSIDTIWPLLAFTNTSNLENVITDIRIINTSGTERALLFTVSDTINARGALLDWEENMLADTRDILGSTARLESAGSFSDIQINLRDARVLRDGEANYIYYGFVSDTVFVITLSESAFASISSAI